MHRRRLVLGLCTATELMALTSLNAPGLSGNGCTYIHTYSCLDLARLPRRPE